MSVSSSDEPAARPRLFGFDREWIIQTGLSLLPGFDRLLMRFAVGKEQPVIPIAEFPWTKYVEGQTPVIRAEAERLLRKGVPLPSIREVSPDHDKIALDDKWRSFFLWGYGVRIEENLAKCPETAKILENIPGLLTAFYSVMQAGAHVPKHTGPTKAILTAHLGLIIPRKRENCHMQVATENLVWEEGKVFIFDDMFDHEVWNDTDEDRVILLLHLKRPLRFPGSLLRDLFFAVLRASPFVKDGVKNLERLRDADAETEIQTAA